MSNNLVEFQKHYPKQKNHAQNNVYIVVFIWNSRKAKLISSDQKQIMYWQGPNMKKMFNILIVVMVVTWVYYILETHWFKHLKWVYFMLCLFHVNRCLNSWITWLLRIIPDIQNYIFLPVFKRQNNSPFSKKHLVVPLSHSARFSWYCCYWKPNSEKLYQFIFESEWLAKLIN